jgi:hypothetical protein
MRCEVPIPNGIVNLYNQKCEFMGSSMPIVLGCDYDVFVSYARQDDVCGKGQDGWVTQFVESLESALRQRLGGSAKALKIFFDREAISSNYQLPEIVAVVKKSAVLLFVGSPCSAASEWTNRELEAFASQTDDRSRMFAIEILPLSRDESYPAAIADHVRLEFWKPTTHRHIPMSISPTSNEDEFRPLVHSLATDIRDKLMVMRLMPSQPRMPVVAPGASAAAAPAANGGGQAAKRNAEEKKALLIAQSTDDVEDDAEQIRQCLRQFEDEIEILPANGYPQGGEAFKAAVNADLARAGLFVQLLGARSGRKPPDLPEGYTVYQLEAAKAAKVPIMQWRHPEMDISGVTDISYWSVLNGETVVASGLEAFKRQILDWVREPRPKPRVARSSTVFINADSKDMTFARQVERECLAHALTTILPMTSQSSEANRQDLAETLTECDLLVFIYGDTTQDWIRAQLRFFSKVKARRESEPRLLAICSGPPPKPDIGISFPNAHVVSCPDGWNIEPIRQLILEAGR